MSREPVRVCVVSDTTAPGYWRLTLPFTEMQKQSYLDEYPIESALCIGQADDRLFDDADVVVVTRLDNDAHYQAICELRKRGKKVIYDLDDDVYNVAENNPAKPHYDDARIAKINEIINEVDHITTTTKILKSKIAEYTKTPITIIKNRIDIAHYSKNPNNSHDGYIRILYTGSTSHQDDCEIIVDPIKQILKEFPNVKMSILGYLHPELKKLLLEKPDQAEYSPFFKSVSEYISATKRVIADIGLCPLRESAFNNSKSCLKYLEYTAMQCATVVSDCLPYSEVVVDGYNGFTATSEYQWYDRIIRLVTHKRTRKHIVENAISTVTKHYNINDSVRQWRSLLHLVAKV